MTLDLCREFQCSCIWVAVDVAIAVSVVVVLLGVSCWLLVAG